MMINFTSGLLFSFSHYIRSHNRVAVKNIRHLRSSMEKTFIIFLFICSSVHLFNLYVYPFIILISYY
jgi:hypothetical protein